MVCSLRDIRFDSNGQIERPDLVLANTDETVIGIIGDAYNISLKLCFNDLSELTFDVPASSPFYDKIVGYRYITVKPFGRFIIINPSEENTGVQKFKTVTAYSAEYELSKKRFVMAEGTYNFHNAIDTTDTIVSIIEETAPSWTIVSISDSLINKFRTFDDINTSVYDFMMNTVQEKYACCFCFDSMTRQIYVYDADHIGKQVPIYLSLDNLAQRIEISELSDEVVTSLYVTGADGIDIRSMNPMGTNRIYNLDSMFKNGNCSDDLVDKWNLWKESFRSYQSAYKALRASYNIANAEIQGETANLVEMQSKLSSLEDIQATLIDHIATGADRADELAEKTSEIEAQQSAITSQQSVIDSKMVKLDAISEQMKSINKASNFSEFFSDSEWKLMQNFILEDQLQDTTFAASSADTYNDPDIIGSFNGNLSVTGATLEKSSVEDLTLYDIRGGIFETSMTSQKLDTDGNTVTDTSLSIRAEIVSGVFQRKSSTNEFVMSLYLNANTTTQDGKAEEYPSGNITIIGNPSSFILNSDSFSAVCGNTGLYLTRNVTEYQTLSIEEELYDYAVSVLDRLSEPEFEFSVDSVNFLFAPEYEPFKNVLELGSSLYLETGSQIVTPLLLEIDLDYDDMTSYSMTFSNKFRRSKGATKFIDLLEDLSHSASSVDFSKFNYDKFVSSGAESAVKTFMNSALDASRNMLKASDSMAVTMDHTGLHLRKSNLDNPSGYDDRQIWMLNNLIAYTDDGFSSVKMALGQFYDDKTGKSCFGIVAPNIVGTLLAGESCIIESAKADSNGIAQFKVDSTGVRINNSTLIMRCDSTSTSSKGEIIIDPKYGFAIGGVGMLSVDSDGVASVDSDKYKLYLDTQGNVHFKGTLDGADGTFSGTLSIGGTSSNPNLYVDASGNLAIGGITKLSTGSANPSANIYLSATGASTFKGTVDATDLKIGGVSVLDTTKGLISAAMINMKNASVTGTDGSYFTVDSNGNVKIKGNIVMNSDSTISWGSSVTTISDFLNSVDSKATDATNTANSAWNVAIDASNTANNAVTNATNSAAQTASQLVAGLANGTYSGTFISGTQIVSPTITGGTINGGTFNAYSDDSGDGYFLYSGSKYGSASKIASITYDGSRHTSAFSSTRALYLSTVSGQSTSIKLYTPTYDSSCGISVEGHHVFIGNADEYGYVTIKAPKISIWGTLEVNGFVYGGGSSSGSSSSGNVAVFG